MVADTGLNQLELGVCVGAWVGIFLLFSIIDVTGATTARLLRTWPGLISHALIVAARHREPSRANAVRRPHVDRGPAADADECGHPLRRAVLRLHQARHARRRHPLYHQEAHPQAMSEHRCVPPPSLTLTLTLILTLTLTLILNLILTLTLTSTDVCHHRVGRRYAATGTRHAAASLPPRSHCRRTPHAQPHAQPHAPHATRRPYRGPEPAPPSTSPPRPGGAAT